MARKKKTEHEDIRQFMEKAASGEEDAGKKMNHDPKLKRFVIVEEGDTETDADDLPAVTPEDLRSFGRA